jgi:hypothetical protein
MTQSNLDSELVQQVTLLIERALEIGPTSELEARFGLQEGRRFSASAPAHIWERMISVLEAFGGWDDVQDWRQERDYIMRDGRRYRCAGGGSARECVTKTKDRNIMSSGRQCAVRFGLSVECPEDTPAGVTAEAVKLARLKLIKRWTYRSFRYDFAKVWSHTDPVAAEAAMMQEEIPQYSLEIEFVDSDYARQHGAEHAARSLILKAQDIAGALQLASA